MNKKLVMLVTNDQALKELVQIVQRELRYITVLSTTDPQKAIRQLRHIKANLLLVDTSTPNALDATRQIRATAITSSIPMVIVTDRDRETGEALAAGADDILVKPIVVIDLKEKIRKYLHRQ